MSEAIKVVLEADSSKLEAALQRGASMVERFESRVKSAGAGRTSGVQLPALELTPESLRQMEAAAARSQDLARKTAMAGASGKNGAIGILAFSQAVEDAQYGIKGVLNNIPQMIIGFGGGAGLAGVLSLAAVAAYGAYQAFQRFSGTGEMKAWAERNDKAVRSFTAALRENREETEALNRAAAAAADLEDRQARAEIGIQKAVGVDRSAYDAMDARRQAADRARSAQDAVLAAGAGLGVSGESARATGEREWRAAALRYATDQKRVTQDLAAAQENLNKVGADYARIWENIGTKAAEFRSARGDAAAAMEDARLRAADAEAELQRARSLAEGAKGSEKLRLEAEIAAAESKLAKNKEIVEARRKEIELYDELIRKSTTEGKNSLEFLSAKKSAILEEITVLKDAAKARQQLAAVEQSKIGLGALQKQQPGLQQDADSARARSDNLEALRKELRLYERITEEGGASADEIQRRIAGQREVADLAEKTGIEPMLAAKILDARDTALKNATQVGGTISERRAARSEERSRERREARDQRVAEAARKRAEKKAEREQKNADRKALGGKAKEGLAAKDELDRAAKAAAGDAKKKELDLQKNQEDQLKAVQNIEKQLQAITSA